MDIRKEIGKNLKNGRKNANFTQMQVANLLNIPQQHYSLFETGKIELDYEKIIFFCNLYDMEPNELFEIKVIKKDKTIKDSINIQHSFNGNNNNIKIK